MAILQLSEGRINLHHLAATFSLLAQVSTFDGQPTSVQPRNQKPVTRMNASVLEVGSVVLSKLPSHIEMWKSDLKSRPMVVTHSDEDFTALIPLTTVGQTDATQTDFFPNASNSLSQRCSPMVRHRILKRAEEQLKKIGQLTPAEVVELHRVTRSNHIHATHFN